MNSTSLDNIALGLGKLVTPEVATRSILLPLGHQMRNALERATEANDWLADNELFYKGEHLVALGFAEREPERAGKHWQYRITAAGLVFTGHARGGWRLPYWVSLSAAGRGELHFDLKNGEHVMLMSRMLEAGWTLTPAVQL